MFTSSLTNSSTLEEPDALETLLNVTDDPGPEPILPPHVAALLGKQLQAFYSQLMSEPVPDRIVQLLRELDRNGDIHDAE